MFYRNITTDLKLGLQYDNGIEISATYLMNEGTILVYEYNAKCGNETEELRFTSEQSKAETFQGLINNHVLKNRY